MTRRCAAARAALVVATAFASGASSAGAQAPGATHLLVIAGAGGEARYREAFHAAGARLAEAAVRRFGMPPSHVLLLAEDSTRPPAAGRSSRAGVERALANIAGRAKPADQVVIVLVGHGSQQGEVARFNLPGPDVTAAEFARLLAPFGTRTVAVVNAASASGEWVRALSAKNRVVITATRSGSEANATLFPHFFVDALAGDGADADKDRRVSLLEAYDYARREVARAFETDNRLLTEHAMLDDDGDGRGTAEPGTRGALPPGGDGALARRIFLGAGPAAAAAASGDSRLAALHARRDSLQAEVEALRARKAAMSAAAYEAELERLLVRLSETTRAVRERERDGGAPGRTP